MCGSACQELQSQCTVLHTSLKCLAFKFQDWFSTVTLTELKPHHFPTESFLMLKNMLSSCNGISTCGCTFYWKEKCFSLSFPTCQNSSFSRVYLGKVGAVMLPTGGPPFHILCQCDVAEVCRIYAANTHPRLLSIGIYLGRQNEYLIWYVIRKIKEHSLLNKLQFVYQVSTNQECCAMFLVHTPFLKKLNISLEHLHCMGLRPACNR